MKNITYILIVCLAFTSCSTVKQTGNPDDMLANIDPFKIETMTVGLNTLLTTGIKQNTAFVFLEPRTNKIWLQFVYDGNKNLVFFDKQARDAYTVAVKKYLEEYETKALIQKSAKMSSAYGYINTVHKWGLFSLNAETVQKTEFGYRFVDDAPYFIITFPESSNALYNGTTGSKIKASVKIVLYFTKAQVLAFSELIAQENLLTLLDGQDTPEKGIEVPDAY